MKKIISLSFFVTILFSCQKNKQDLKLELLTNEIICVENVKQNDFYEVVYQPNATYDSLSKNILRYKITNISNKKYFIMLNENILETLEPDLYKEAMGKKNYINPNCVALTLYKNNYVLHGSSTKMESMCGNIFESNKIEELDTIVYKFLRKNRIEKICKVEFINILNDSVQGYFLQPGETKYFTSIVNLPYRKNEKWFSNIEKKKPNLGSLSLQNDSIFTNRKISQDEKKNIAENGYILFDGIIYSNKVPVKLIKI
ncbi:hypothetical protein [Flavobacterium sp. FlaQc-47]|jgi:hypothetical protein|uniref:hypothetical protein n=1 Tax=Flavobacterium sp. FlaQc-47 TaxID=3374180 RepID=UPI0037571494